MHPTVYLSWIVQCGKHVVDTISIAVLPQSATSMWPDSLWPASMRPGHEIVRGKKSHQQELISLAHFLYPCLQKAHPTFRQRNARQRNARMFDVYSAQLSVARMPRNVFEKLELLKSRFCRCQDLEELRFRSERAWQMIFREGCPCICRELANNCEKPHAVTGFYILQLSF